MALKSSLPDSPEAAVSDLLLYQKKNARNGQRSYKTGSATWQSKRASVEAATRRRASGSSCRLFVHTRSLRLRLWRLLEARHSHSLSLNQRPC